METALAAYIEAVERPADQFYVYLELAPHLVRMFKERDPRLIPIWSQVVANTEGTGAIYGHLMTWDNLDPDIDRITFDALVDALFQRLACHDKTFVVSKMWTKSYFLYLLPKFAAVPQAIIASHTIISAIRDAVGFLEPYFALAKQYPKLPIPNWRSGPNPTFAITLVPRSAEFVREYMAAGAPASTFNFKSASLATLHEAEKYSALLEVLRRDISRDHFMSLCKHYAKKLFALIVVVTDGYLRPTLAAHARFFAIAARLPMELQSYLASTYAEAPCPQSLSDKRLKWALDN